MRYSELKQELRNAYLFKQDKYPKTIVEALSLLKNYVPGHLASKKISEGTKKRTEGTTGLCRGRWKLVKKHPSILPMMHTGAQGKTVYCCHDRTRNREFLDKRWKDSQEKEKKGVANLGEWTRKTKNIRQAEAERFQVPEGAPSYEEYLKKLGYNLFTCGVGDKEAHSGSSVGSLGSFLEEPMATVSWVDKVRGIIFEEGQEWEAQDGVEFVGPGEKAKHDVSHLNQEKGLQNTLSTWKLYLDSCTTYHLVFVDWCLDNVRSVGVSLTGHCNAGTTTSTKKGLYGQFEMWLNKQGIPNLLSILQLEEDGYVVDYNTNRDWVVTTPQGEKIKFKRDTGLCNHMPYIDMKEQTVGVTYA